MGRAKALLPIGPETFLARIVRTFLEAGVDDVIVVLGHEADTIAEALAATSLSARVAVNPQYDRGQLSSLLTGLAVADRPGVEAILLTLVDVPMVSVSTVRAVIDCYRAVRAPIVRPVSGDRHGHPIAIDRSLFALLRSADPDAGAKPIVRAHSSARGDVAVDDEGAFRDVDTAEEYAELISAGSGGVRAPRPGED
jgi:molybdenum cofactor cytidylyltransferase